jgi:phosphoribosylglycinamide formyltransferase 2
MLNGAELDRVVSTHKPDIIVPEIEAIRTERFYDYEKQGIQVVAQCARGKLHHEPQGDRNLAAQELGIRTRSSLTPKRAKSSMPPCSKWASRAW